MRPVLWSCLIVFASCTAAVIAIFLYASRDAKPPRPLRAVPEFKDGSFECPQCRAAGRPVKFLAAGDLLEHEIQDHPHAGRP